MNVIFLALLCVKSEPIPDRNRLSHRSKDPSLFKTTSSQGDLLQIE